MPEPKLVVAVGDCARNCGVFAGGLRCGRGGRRRGAGRRGDRRVPAAAGGDRRRAAAVDRSMSAGQHRPGARRLGRGLGHAAGCAALVAAVARPGVGGADVPGRRCGGLMAGVAALAGDTWSGTARLPAAVGDAGSPGSRVGGFFMALSGGSSIASACTRRLRPPRCRRPGRRPPVRSRCSSAAMLLVPAAGNVTTFLLAWELMALASLVLVLAEHRARPEVRGGRDLVRRDDPAGFVGDPARPGAARRGGRRRVASPDP